MSAYVDHNIALLVTSQTDGIAPKNCVYHFESNAGWMQVQSVHDDC